MPDDAELIARAQAGEVEAFGELYQRYLDPVYRYLGSRVADQRDAEDLTELVFLRCFQALNRYEERGWAFSAYLYQVARNLLADHYRQDREEEPLETADRMGTPEQALDEGVVQAERVQAMRRSLAELPFDYQEVIRLRVVLALPTKTVAAWMKRSEGAVRVLLCRALKALRKRMVEEHA